MVCALSQCVYLILMCIFKHISFLKVKDQDQDQNNVFLERYMPNHLRGTRAGPVRLPLPTPPLDQVPGPPGHVDCEQTNGNVLLRRYLPNHLRRQ